MKLGNTKVGNINVNKMGKIIVYNWKDLDYGKVILLKKQFFCVFGFGWFFLLCSLQTVLNSANTMLMRIHKIKPVVWIYTCHFTSVQEQSPKMLGWSSQMIGFPIYPACEAGSYHCGWFSFKLEYGFFLCWSGRDKREEEKTEMEVLH